MISPKLPLFIYLGVGLAKKATKKLFTVLESHMICQNVQNIVGKFLIAIKIPSDARIMRRTTFTAPEQGLVKMK